MITLALAAVLVGDEALNEAAKKFAANTNYTFKVTSKVDGGGGKGGGGGSADCAYDGTNPLYIKAQNLEAYSQNGKIVTRGQDGSWAVLEAPQKGEKPDKGERAKAALRSLRIPHEELGSIDAKLQEVTNEKEGDLTVYSATLTTEGARDLNSGGRKGGGKGGEYSGSAKFWVDANGAITKYEIVVTMKGKAKEKEINLTTTRTVEITGIGSAKVEIPEDAKKLF